MIKLKAPMNYRGELVKEGARVSLSPLIENRMVENGLAVRIEETLSPGVDLSKKTKQNEDTKQQEGSNQQEDSKQQEYPQKDQGTNSLICSICGKVCKNQLGFKVHYEACQKKAQNNA